MSKPVHIERRTYKPIALGDDAIARLQALLTDEIDGLVRQATACLYGDVIIVSVFPCEIRFSLTNLIGEMIAEMIAVTDMDDPDDVAMLQETALALTSNLEKIQNYIPDDGGDE